jgi:cytochrome b6-f complex iron-sulfur subunit
VPTNDRFECPCHGSKYLANGTRVDGPATRNLDKFVLEALDANGKVIASTKVGDPNSESDAGAPFVLPADAKQIRINTGQKIQGASNTKPGGGK